MMRIVLAVAMALLSLAPSFAVPAQAEVVAHSDAGFVVTGSTDVPGRTPAEVWSALIAPARWWDGHHTISGDAANLFLDPQAGGCFCELLPAAKDAPAGARRGSIEHARVIAAMPGELLRLSGAFGPLQAEAMLGIWSVHLKAAGGGTQIAWEYVAGGFSRLPADQIAPAFDHILADQMARLAAYAKDAPKDSQADPAPGAPSDSPAHR